MRRVVPSLPSRRTRSWIGFLRGLLPRGRRADRVEARGYAAGAGRSASLDQRLIHTLSRTGRRLPSWRQIRHLPEVLSSNDSLRLQLGAILLIVGLGVVGARAYAANTVMAPAIGGTIREGVVGTTRSLNPILSVANDVDADLTRLIFSRLFAVDGQGRVTPELVERYDISSDQKTYTLTLRNDVRWHDGEPLTAADVAFTFALIQDPAWKSPLHAAFKDATVERVGDYDVRVTLKEPFAPFLSRLSFGILPRHVWKDVTPQNASLHEANLKPVGSGPFMFSSLKRDRRGFVLSYAVTRNPAYFKDTARIDEIDFTFYPDYISAIGALKRREIDSLSFVPRDMRAEVKDVAHALPVSLELPQYAAVFFNRKRNPLLEDRDVRLALSMGIDKVRILFDVLGGDGHPVDAPPLPGYEDLEHASIPYKLDEAAALLESKGWKIDPEDGLRKRVDGDRTDILRVTLTTVDQTETMEVAKIIKNGWSALGVDTIIQPLAPSDIHRMAVKPREYEALLYSQLLGADPDPYPFWHSSQVQDPGLNLALFSNPKADAAIEAAQKTADPDERARQYRTFLETLSDDLPAAFLYSPTYTYVLPAELKGFGGTRVTTPADRFASVTSWYLKTARVWKGAGDAP